MKNIKQNRFAQAAVKALHDRGLHSLASTVAIALIPARAISPIDLLREYEEIMLLKPTLKTVGYDREKWGRYANLHREWRRKVRETIAAHDQKSRQGGR